MWREARKDLEPLAAEFNKLVRAEVRRLRSAEDNGREGQHVLTSADWT
jgi:hypothetical protein